MTVTTDLSAIEEISVYQAIGGHIGGHGHAWLLSRGGLPRRSASRACPRLSNGYSFPLFAPPANE